MAYARLALQSDALGFSASFSLSSDRPRLRLPSE
jgi:hypothetical protein